MNGRSIGSSTEKKMEGEAPQWLAFLQELLSSSQYNFITRVYCSIRHKAQLVNEASEARVREIVRMAETLKKIFELVVELLQKKSFCKENFLQYYLKWRQIRDMNISHLRKIASTIDGHEKNCQPSKSIGSLISLIGVGICLAPGQTSKVIGSALMGIGALTSAWTTDEEMLLKLDVCQAENILQSDQKCMEYLQDWLDDASCLQKAMTNIRSIACDEFQTVADRLQTISEENLSPEEIEREILNTLKSLDLPEELRKEVSDIIGILITVTMLFDRFRPLFNFISADLFKAAYIDLNSVSTLINCGAQWRAAHRMVLDAFKILHVFSQDPNSVEGREIRRVAAELEKEANEVEILYILMKTQSHI